MDYRMPVITTKRLILRPVCLKDAPSIYAYSKDPRVTQYVTYDTYTSIEDAYWAIENIFLPRVQKNQFESYAIVLKETNQMIGTCDCSIVRFADNGEIGYVMHRDYWGQGYMTEAVRALCRVLFEEKKMRRLEVTHHPDNIGAKKVIEKVGFIYEGDRRAYCDLGDGYRDFPSYSMLKGDLK